MVEVNMAVHEGIISMCCLKQVFGREMQLCMCKLSVFSSYVHFHARSSNLLHAHLARRPADYIHARYVHLKAQVKV